MVNLYRVTTGSDLKKLLQENQHRITAIFYSDDLVPGCKANKPLFVKASKTFTDCMFVFLDLRKYDDQDAGFTTNLSGALPKYMFYYDLENIAHVNGAQFDKFISILNHLLQRLQQTRQEQTQTQTPKPKLKQDQEQDHNSTPTESNDKTTGSEKIPTPVTEHQLEFLRKMHAVQKKKMLAEIAKLNYLKTQQQKVLLNQSQQLQRMKMMKIEQEQQD